MSSPSNEHDQEPSIRPTNGGNDGGANNTRKTANGTGDDGDQDWLLKMAAASSLTFSTKADPSALTELNVLTTIIGNTPGTIACLVVGHDGSLIAGTTRLNIDLDDIAVWSLGAYMNTVHVVKKMGPEHVHQILAKTTAGQIVIADFGGGLLVTVGEH